MPHLRGIIPSYTSDDIAIALRLLADQQPDEDIERRSDLIIALRDLSTVERRAVSLWAYGYTMREIAEQVLGNQNRNEASRLVGRALTNVRSGMNNIERGDKG